MCRGCLFVQVDEESGDIDGCWKADIFEDMLVEYPDNPKLKELYEAFQNESILEKCYEELVQPEPEDQAEFRRQWIEWFRARDRAVKRFEADLRNKVEEEAQK